jgi:hypothetical protein
MWSGLKVTRLHEESFPRDALKKIELVTAGGSRREDGVFMVN